MRLQRLIQIQPFLLGVREVVETAKTVQQHEETAPKAMEKTASTSAANAQPEAAASQTRNKKATFRWDF
jgi:hypothetical protein